MSEVENDVATRKRAAEDIVPSTDTITTSNNAGTANTITNGEETKDLSTNSNSNGNKPVKKRKKFTLNTRSTAENICAAFFVAMDLDGNGFIEESEVKIISVVAFNEDEQAAAARWKTMLQDMDEDEDQKISKNEYVKWWVNYTKDKKQEDGSFIEGYASFLLKCLLRITSVKTANDICEAFFVAMDANDDGFLVEDEIKNISKWAFGAKEDRAHSTWLEMQLKMDTNKDNKISKEEYSDYWMVVSKDKIRADGTFDTGYKHYLLSKLAKLKAGKRRQDQLKVWKENYGETESKEEES